jgi:hypothetical protein
VSFRLKLHARRAGACEFDAGLRQHASDRREGQHGNAALAALKFRPRPPDVGRPGACGEPARGGSQTRVDQAKTCGSENTWARAAFAAASIRSYSVAGSPMSSDCANFSFWICGRNTR